MDPKAFRALSVFALVLAVGGMWCWGRVPLLPKLVTVDIGPIVHKEAVELAEQPDTDKTLPQQLATFKEKLQQDLDGFARKFKFIVAPKGILNGDIPDVTEEFIKYKNEQSLASLLEWKKSNGISDIFAKDRIQ